MEIRETLRTPVKYECDVLVVGGGFAGIAAAAAAARAGRRVILTERMFMLGGLGTAGLVTVYLPLCDGYGRQVSFGLAEELLRLSIEHHNDGKRGYRNWVSGEDAAHRGEKDPRFEVNFNPQFFAISAEQFLLSLGVKILYGTYAVAASMKEGGKIDAVIAENKSGRFAILARSFVDASGDADLAVFSGAPTALFGQGNILASWYYYVDKEGVYSRKMLGFCDIPEEEKKAGRTVEYLSSRRYTGIDGEEISEFMEAAHASLLSDVQKHRKDDPTCEPATIATIPQLRMTRRVAGEYTLDITEEHKVFADSCGMVSDWRRRGPVFEVPFRTLYSATVKNLIFAGRCTSVTDSMWDVMRVIPCCSVTGEAAGCAAALTDDFPALDVSLLQEKLRTTGVVLHEEDLSGK